MKLWQNGGFKAPIGHHLPALARPTRKESRKLIGLIFIGADEICSTRLTAIARNRLALGSR
jgi:hypothetical protein